MFFSALDIISFLSPQKHFICQVMFGHLYLEIPQTVRVHDTFSISLIFSKSTSFHPTEFVNARNKSLKDINILYYHRCFWECKNKKLYIYIYTHTHWNWTEIFYWPQFWDPEARFIMLWGLREAPVLRETTYQSSFQSVCI